MFDVKETPAQREARTKQQTDKQFNDWLERRETKLIVSLIPATEQPEVLPSLLRSAFDAGVGAGTGNVAMEMLGALMRKESRE